jgi:hypothetical protein
MRTVRATGFVVIGVVLGVGAMVGSTHVGAQTKSTRIDVGKIEFAGAVPMVFFRDTQTNSCYLGALDNAARMTAVTAVPITACSK